MKEYEIFKPLKDFLIRNGVEGEFYAEVPADGTRADVVLKQGKIITVFEMKTSLNFKVIEQAFHWRGLAHYTYIVIPQWKHNWFVMDLLQQYGIGLIECDPKTYNACMRIKPKLWRKIGLNWDELLIEEMKNNVGGTTGEEYLTPYKITIQRVKHCLKVCGELSMEDLLNKVTTHYANPKQGLYNTLTKFESDWCEKFKKDGKIYFKIRETKD